ncbi:hypothetical protein WKI65_42710 [Streptomyces sp. MS1.AVA.3]
MAFMIPAVMWGLRGAEDRRKMGIKSASSLASDSGKLRTAHWARSDGA